MPRGRWSRPLPRRRSQAGGLGRCPTGSPRWQPLQNVKKKKKKISPPPGRAGSRDKMVPFWTRAAVARRQGQDSGWPGAGEGAGPTGGRFRPAGAGQAAASWAGRRTGPRTHPRALAAAAAAAGEGWRRGWCIQGEAPPSRVSSPRTLPGPPAARLAAAVGRTQPRAGTWAAIRQLADSRGKARTRPPNLPSFGASEGRRAPPHPQRRARCFSPHTCASGQQGEGGARPQVGRKPAYAQVPLQRACSPAMELKGKAWGSQPPKEKGQQAEELGAQFKPRNTRGKRGQNFPAVTSDLVKLSCTPSSWRCLCLPRKTEAEG